MNRELWCALTVPLIVLLLGLAVAAGLGLGPVLEVWAQGTIYVDDDTCPAVGDGSAGNPYCSIQTAIDNAGDLDTISVASGTYAELLDVTGITLTISGAGATSTIVDATGKSGTVVDLWTGAVVTITGLTVQNGVSSFGGGLRTNGCTLALANSTVFSNAANSGAGIYNDGGGTAIISNCTFISNTTTTGTGGGLDNYESTMVIENSAIVSNTADTNGGGIYSDGMLLVRNSTVRGNHASSSTGGGGGIWLQDGSATLTNVTISSNTSDNDGGGIRSQAPATLTNVTVSGNTATDSGGGIFNVDPLTITNGAIVSNTASYGGGIYNVTGNLIYVKNTIVAYNTADNCDNNGTITSYNYNLEDTDTCSFSAGADKPSTDPLLGPLADNGGPTRCAGQALWTHALPKNSPAIDAASCTDVGGITVTADQRGYARPVDIAGVANAAGGCDIGAHEKLNDVYLPLVMRNYP
jgi:predicted outer membrane repeat protein